MTVDREEAAELLHGTTPGPWPVLSNRHTAQDPANARLMAAAPDLAATVVHLWGEVEALREALRPRVIERMMIDTSGTDCHLYQSRTHDCDFEGCAALASTDHREPS